METTIQHTTNYTQFKTLTGNRPIFHPHLRRLIDAIEKNNMLAQNPIIVNKQLYVIDGQHRLAAAKTLGLPIPYVIKEEADLTQVQMLNANNRSWTTYDYLQSYIAKGYQEYIQLRAFADAYRISVPIAMRILSGTFHSKHLLHDFKTGRFVIKNKEEAESLVNLVVEVRKHSPDNSWAHNACIQALAQLNTSTNPRLFIEALSRNQQVITRRVSRKEYLAEFETILKAGGYNPNIHLA